MRTKLSSLAVISAIFADKEELGNRRWIKVETGKEGRKEKDENGVNKVTI